MAPWLLDAVEIGVAALLVAVNGFFVAAEFALVKVRPAALDELIAAGRPFARTARWLYDRLDASLSACQLGITMASLGFGWVGEPALASLFEPLFRFAGLQSQALLHGVAFTVAFSIITAAHLVIGEQTPKIFAIRQPVRLALWCALPLANPDVDTFSGYLVDRLGRFPVVGDSVTLDGGTAEVLEIRRARAIRVRVTLDP